MKKKFHDILNTNSQTHAIIDFLKSVDTPLVSV